MVRRSETALTPRNGHALVVAIVCRISGGPRQKEASLEDQEDNAREAIAELYQGTVEFHVISTTSKGEALDRPELEEVERAYRSGRYDIFAYDDLGRLIRGGEAARLLGIGVDCGTRSICIADGIDTADETWEEDALNACSENVAHNARTSKRIKTKTMNRFKKHGFTPRRPIAGYIVPSEATSFADWQRDDAATTTIGEAAVRLKESLNCSMVADWLNEREFPTGPCRRSRKQWYGKMVREYFKNPILKGLPWRGRHHTVKRHETGRRKSVKNPKGPNFFSAPHLAHLEPAFFDELNELLAAKNGHYQRRGTDGVDTRAAVPKKRTRYPGQTAVCWYCGMPYVWGGNGMTENLMCSGSREYHCFNSIGFEGALAAKRIASVICAELDSLAGFGDQFESIIRMADEGAALRNNDLERQLRSDEAAVATDRRSVERAILECGDRSILKKMLDDLDAKERSLAKRRLQMELHTRQELELPSSAAELRDLTVQEFSRLAIDSPEFGFLLGKLVPDFHVYLVRLCDGGHLYSRARVRLNLGGTFPDVNVVPGLGDLLMRDMTLDLFDPPQRERIRLQAVELESADLRPKQIAERIDEKPTATAVQNALNLQRCMTELGLDSPYVTILEPPVDYTKLRRHKNARYEFRPKDGYIRVNL